MSTEQTRIEAALRHGIWRVTLDGAFYGDYRSKLQTTEAMDDLALGLRAKGQQVNISWKPA